MGDAAEAAQAEVRMTNMFSKPKAPATPGVHPRPAAKPDESGSCYAEYTWVLSEQRGLVGQLDALSQRQGKLIDSPDVDLLLAVLDERQQIIDRLVSTSRMTEQLRRQWELVQPTLPEAQRQDITRQVDALAMLASEVALRDERDHSRLKKRLDSLASELAGVATSRRAASAYSPACDPDPRPRFQDQQA